jgi:hypothetical protein
MDKTKPSVLKMQADMRPKTSLGVPTKSSKDLLASAGFSMKFQKALMQPTTVAKTNIIQRNKVIAQPTRPLSSRSTKKSQFLTREVP